ncbi:MAG: SpoIIE family protein phosphatase [Blautia sp.]|nr:SpoIIE family protein phosphatase [Blautia sp.]
MKKILGITFGGLQKKTVSLVLMVLFATIAVFSLGIFYQNKMLVSLVETTRSEQEQSISRTSQETMNDVMEGTLSQTTALQANITDNDFSEVVHYITMLQSMALSLLESKDEVVPAPISLPDPANDGVLSAMALCEEGVDYTRSEYLGKLAHLSNPMIAMVESSDKISCCYIGLSDGTHLSIDSSSSNRYDENGRLIPYPVRQRPWYRGAAETGGLYFTALEKDAFSGEPCITCSIPIIMDEELIGVAGIDITLENINEYIISSATEHGFLFVVNEKGQVLLSPEENGVFQAEVSDQAEDLRTIGNEALAQLIDTALERETGLSVVSIDGRDYYMAGAPMPTIGWALMSVVEKEYTELPEKMLLAEYERTNQAASARFRSDSSRGTRISVVIIILIIIVGTIAALVAARHIVKPIEVMTQNIIESSQTGKMFEMKKVYRTDDEIEVLAEAFLDLSTKTRKYIKDITRITREKERVSTELQMANRIQNSMIPNVFPPFPGRSEFDIYASMTPAREVGGDFYDFFLIDQNHLCMVMADVSGKGIPAALFMMISKVILQSCAMLGKGAGEILVKTNQAICSSNQVDMFVTVWTGILEISTGKITAANAGHEYPAILRDGRFSLIRDKHGLVIGGMQGIKYREYTITLEPGDKLFLYTDGIPEASDSDYKMFGTQKMLDALNQDTKAAPKQILANVKAAVEDFVQGAEQFDDMTMLCLEYKGPDSE